MTRLKTVGIMGSSTQAIPELSRAAGRIVAELGCHLLTGGGPGAMEEACRAFCETTPRRGVCIGILKGRTSCEQDGSRVRLMHTPSAPNVWVEVPIHTHLPLSGIHGRELGSRNSINVLSSDALIALPGGAGTYSEVTLRIDYGKPLILFIGNDTIEGHGADHFTSRAFHDGQVSVASSPEELEALLRHAISTPA